MKHYRRRKVDERLVESRRQGLKAWRRRDEAARLAIPPTLPELRPGDQWLHWQISGLGGNADVQLLIPPNKGRRRPRSDQFALVVDGAEIAERMSMTAVLRYVQSIVLTKQASREQRGEMSALVMHKTEDFE